jgi:hypothetical protein
MATLQANDAQLMQQLNDTMGQLQNAYNEIAARQTADAGTSVNDDDGGSRHDEDEHDEHEHEDDDHGDDRDEGDDD